jgi:hypothetical protein
LSEYWLKKNKHVGVQYRDSHCRLNCKAQCFDWLDLPWVESEAAEAVNTEGPGCLILFGSYLQIQQAFISSENLSPNSEILILYSLINLGWVAKARGKGVQE